MTIIQRISTHALREEGDNRSPFVPCSRMIFLPTPSARRATRRRVPHVHVLAISTHALREEGDATLLGSAACTINISTHALREEGDSPPRPARPCSRYFYPRPPRGGRQIRRRHTCPCPYFYPRPPRGGRLLHPAPKGFLTAISTHALREEGDSARSPACRSPRYFYPRPPRGGRRGA